MAVVVGTAWYLVEPWAVTFIDDGPYFSADYPGPIADLTVYSEIELRRFGRAVYRLESRLLDKKRETVLVLRSADGSTKWARLPIKPYGELGPIEFRRQRLTWYGGWRIGIKPANQEGGYLYLGTFGRYRFLNHSW